MCRNFIVGRCTASAIVSASRKWFFCPFEYGRTYFGMDLAARIADGPFLIQLGFARAPSFRQANDDTKVQPATPKMQLQVPWRDTIFLGVRPVWAEPHPPTPQAAQSRSLKLRRTSIGPQAG